MCRIKLPVLLVLTLLLKAAAAQDVYGPDPNLYNGKVYTFFMPANVSGNQYLSDRQFIEGSVKIRGSLYTGLLLNYDVYNQRLILSYANLAGGNSLLELSDAWLEGFSLGTKEFVLMQTPDSLKKIYRRIGQDSLCLLYFTKKRLEQETKVDALNLRFSKPVVYRYLYDGHQMKLYTRNRSFVTLFPDSKQAAIRKYIKQHRIRVNKSPDDLLLLLIEYCNTL